MDEETRIPFPRQSLPRVGKAKRRRLRRRKRKPTPPRCARQPLPREGARVDTPSFLWKEMPRRGGGWMEGSGMKESEGDLLKCVVYESTLSTAARSPLPNGEGCETRIPLFSTQRLSQGERQRGVGFAAEKGSQPRLAVLGSPFQGKGLAWTLPPSYGRRCPEGAEVGWGKRDEKERGSSQVDDSRKHLLQENSL